MTTFTLPAHKLIIGLTGNIATGKSAVMKLAAAHGALTIDADAVVHDILNDDTAVQEAIAARFGDSVHDGEGRINRPALGAIVFSDPAALQALEALVHPAVHRRILEQIQATQTAVVMIEAIKLLEGRLHTICHQIWVTRCTREHQLDRLRICRGMARDEAERRIDAQNPQAAKVARADVVIDTDGLMRDTQLQFDLAWARLPDPATLPARTISYAVPTAPAAKSAPAKSATATTPQLLEHPDNLMVRRARPSDVPSMLLLFQQIYPDAEPRTRIDLLQALGQRGYFIGQVDNAILAVAGWHVDSNVGRIEDILVAPLDTAVVAFDGILVEIERSARQHICGVSLAYLPANASPAVGARLRAHGYKSATLDDLPRDGRTAVEETLPTDSDLLVKFFR